MALWVDSVDVGVGCGVLGQHLDEPPVGQVALDVPLGAHEDAVAVQCPVDRDPAVVGGQVAAGLDGFGGDVLATSTGQAPQPVGLFALADADAVVFDQVVGHPGCAVSGQVGGRRAEQPPVGRDVAGDHACVGRRAEAYADVERVVGQRGRIDRKLQLHLHLRVLAHEA
ncbi:hypothetical protein D9M69_556310 [compost metagenome]